ncbi:neuroglobin-like [Cimex lectularius]|uniref:Globin domain-containing protein n=1 Tax=Cimex lectularius TaxID=79782 RepID=A0A8I6RNF0_CIMLE|nr:neuroglobin-like [Cimex lectularius]
MRIPSTPHSQDLPVWYSVVNQESASHHIFKMSLPTAEQVQEVQEAWKLVQPDFDGAGRVLFTVMFEKFPSYEDFFKKHKESNKSLLDSTTLQPHIRLVMKTLDYLVVNLNDMSVVEERLVKLGQTHKGRNVKSPQFNHIVEIVLETLRRALGPKLTPGLEASWKAVLNCAMTIAGNEADK